MKERTIHRFKNLSHIILVVISMMLSINLFIQFSNSFLVKILLGFTAFALELLKVYLLIEAKFHFRIKEKLSKLKASVETFVYLGLALSSIVASLGFTLLSIEEQSLQFSIAQSASNFEIDQLITQIEANNKQIEIIQENATGLEFSAVERNAEANRQIAEIQEKNKELISKVQELRDEKQLSIEEQGNLTSVDMFNLLGALVDKSGQDAMFFLMFTIVFMLEIAIALTCGEIIIEDPLRENRYELMAYIDSLFNVKGKRLNSDDTIQKETGIALNNCKRYRDLLLKTHYNNIPLIESNRGGTTGNFTKDITKKIIALQSNSTIHRRQKK